jgi:hypothetical protein
MLLSGWVPLDVGGHECLLVGSVGCSPIWVGRMGPGPPGEPPKPPYCRGFACRFRTGQGYDT